MKRAMVVVLGLFLLVASCRGGGSSVADLQKSNEDLTRRVKALEDQQLEGDKKLIREQQALQSMNERLRDVEGFVDKMRLGPR